MYRSTQALEISFSFQTRFGPLANSFIQFKLNILTKRDVLSNIARNANPDGYTVQKH